MVLTLNFTIETKQKNFLRKLLKLRGHSNKFHVIAAKRIVSVSHGF